MAALVGLAAAARVVVLAYIDDATVVCDVELAEFVSDCMEAALAPVGFCLNIGKHCVCAASLQRPGWARAPGAAECARIGHHIFYRNIA